MRSECVCNAARAMFRSLGGIELLRKRREKQATRPLAWFPLRRVLAIDPCAPGERRSLAAVFGISALHGLPAGFALVLCKLLCSALQVWTDSNMFEDVREPSEICEVTFCEAERVACFGSSSALKVCRKVASSRLSGHGCAVLRSLARTCLGWPGRSRRTSRASSLDSLDNVPPKPTWP